MDTYEKKYKDAQKWIESIYSELSHEQQMEAEAFFPELAESDERIRNWLIGYFHQYKEDGMEKYANGLKVESIIAWLEKQGVQNPADEEMKELLRTEYEKGRSDAIAEMQKLAWSEEDEMIALSIEQVINCASLLNIVPEKIDKIRTWLKSLKDRL